MLLLCAPWSRSGSNTEGPNDLAFAQAPAELSQVRLLYSGSALWQLPEQMWQGFPPHVTQCPARYDSGEVRTSWPGHSIQAAEHCEAILRLCTLPATGYEIPTKVLADRVLIYYSISRCLPLAHQLQNLTSHAHDDRFLMTLLSRKHAEGC